MKSKPWARSLPSTSRIASGWTSSAPLPRKWTLSITASPSSWRSSSRPVASGIEKSLGPRFLDRHELLGADRVVTLAPAGVAAGDDLLAQLEDPVHQRLRARRAARHVHGDRHELVGRHDRVVVEDAHRARAGAHGDPPLRLEHLVPDAADDRRHLDRDPARQDEQVGLARAGAEGLEPEARDVDAR